MDNPLQSAMQKMGSNFLVAAFVPSMAFTIASYLSFRPLFISSNVYDPLIPSELLQLSFILLLSSTILGFTLYTLSTYIYKAFEGYTFVLAKQSRLRHSFLQRQIRRYERLAFQRKTIEKQLEKLGRRIRVEEHTNVTGKWRNRRLTRLIAQQSDLKSRKYNLTSILDHNFPSSRQLMLPTRFGNVLAAAEYYPKRYGIDAVPIWSKLVSAIPSKDGMMEKINEANNQCQFLLNGALLWTLFAGGCLAAAIFKIIFWVFKLQPSITNHDIWTLIYLMLAGIAVGFAFFFYEASLFNVGQFGSMIRATYDLYRFRLLDALHLKLPKSLDEEKKTWQKLSRFMTGNLEDDANPDQTIDFKYSHPPKGPHLSKKLC